MAHLLTETFVLQTGRLQEQPRRVQFASICPQRAIKSTTLNEKRNVCLSDGSDDVSCGGREWGSSWGRAAGSGLLACGLSLCLMLGSASTGMAKAEGIEYVNPDQVTSLAKPMKKQKVDKGRIWLLFVLGASSLFGVTVLVENNPQWFPAIAKANKAMAAAQEAYRKREEEKERQQRENVRLEGAVLSGLSEARSQVDIPNIVETTEKYDVYEATVPQQLDVEEADLNEGDDEETLKKEEEESDSGHGSEDRQPLFEISGDDIDKSSENFLRKKKLEEMSVEELREELERRQAEQ